MLILIALAAAALTPAERSDIRCVAVVGVAGRTYGGRAIAAGREYAVIVGADVMDRTGATREDVANLMLAQGKDVVARQPAPSELADCLLRANARLASDAAATAPLPVPLPVPQR